MEIPNFFSTFVLLVVTSISESFSLYDYQVRPSITITVGNTRLSRLEGYYDPDYVVSPKRDISRANLIVIDNPCFGCPTNQSYTCNATLPDVGTEYFVVMVPLQGCYEYQKFLSALNLWKASGLLFYYGDSQSGVLRNRPRGTVPLSGITVASVRLSPDQVGLLRKGGLVSITRRVSPFQTSQTFYFIVFAFCILMFLSCLWFVMSYLKRCHYSMQRRRRRVSLKRWNGVSPTIFVLSW